MDESTRSIPLTKGYAALVDAADYEWLSQWKWCAKENYNTVYAQRWQSNGGLGQTVLMHRVLMKASPREQVDHWNGNGLGNRRQNLRACTNQQNQYNQKIRPGTKSSRFKGVSWYKQSSKWRASIRINGVSRHIGLFKKEEEAALAYDRAATKAWGEFARLNL